MSFQQGTQKVEVVVRRAGGGSGIEQPQGAKPTDDVSLSGGQSSSIGRGKNASNRLSKNSIMHYGNMAKQMAMKVGRYYIGGVKYNTGDEALQDMVDRTVEVVTDWTNVAAQTAFGAYYGARFGGPIGALIGGATSLASGVLGIGMDFAAARRDYNMKVFKEENGIAYRRARADINFTNGRLR